MKIPSLTENQSLFLEAAIVLEVFKSGLKPDNDKLEDLTTRLRSKVSSERKTNEVKTTFV